MKKLLLVSALIATFSTFSLSIAKTPHLTTPSMTEQEYANALGFELKGETSDEAHKSVDDVKKSVQKQMAEPAENGKSALAHPKKENNDDRKENESTQGATMPEKLPLIEEKDLVYQCDISLAQPFAVEKRQNIELALGDRDGDELMVIKIRKTPILMKKTHYEPEHLHIWSNTEHNIIMTLEVEEVYKDKFVALQSGTLSILSPKLKEDYKAVLTCKR